VSPVLPFACVKAGLRTAAAISAETMGVMNFFMGSPAMGSWDIGRGGFLALNVTAK
jgi:hypothetical protein